MDKRLKHLKKHLSSSKKKDYNQQIKDISSIYGFKEFVWDESFSIVQPENLNDYYKKGYFLFFDKKKQICVAISSLDCFLLENTKDFNLDRIFLLHKENFKKTLFDISSEFNTKLAQSYLQETTRFHSAQNVDYNKVVLGFSILFFSLMTLSINLFELINNVIYILQNILKSILFATGAKYPKEHSSDSFTKDFPIYSVLVPLYKEELKTESILRAMTNLEYPKDKLDIKFILEADDLITSKSLGVLDLPDYVEVIKVPKSFPRTKPKALNYAISFVKGEYLTVYDAEDEPEPRQLLKAICAFSKLSPNYACLQARLNFYNANENMLSKFFSIEYSIWFDYLLKGLSRLSMPVTLGGTSNHFKVNVLKKIGLWDAYNVTEDADLGIRLYLNGYKVHMIDSITMEESPTRLTDWLAQRSRWIKGFIQTLCVFTKTKVDYTIFSRTKALVVYIFVGLSTYSFLFLPWLLALLILNLSPAWRFLWLINSLCLVFYMYVTAYFTMSRQNSFVKLNTIKNYFVFFLWPCYFILHTIAAYRSVWEVLKSPFKWNKTPHGNYEKFESN